MKRAIPLIVAALVAVSALSAQSAATSTKDLKALVAAAKKEGQLTVIALPHDWVNYGEMIQKFSDTYGIKVNELNPDGSSGEEIEAIKANKDNKGPQAPDVIDVGLSFGPSAQAEGLLAPYKVQTWSSIPADIKDKDGYWYGDYYGALAFEVNADLVKNPPKDWGPTSRSPSTRARSPSPETLATANQAIMTVVAASLASGGSLKDMGPGLKFFDKLNKAGNFVPLIAVPGTVASGETPITVRWDYNALANRDKSAGNPNISVIIPASGVVAGVYVQAISAYAPNPNAARLWMEFLYSDEGQLIWLKGYGHPARFNDLAKRKAIPADVAAKLPPSASYAKAVFPSLADQDAEKTAIADGWDKVVGIEVQKK